MKAWITETSYKYLKSSREPLYQLKNNVRAWEYKPVVESLLDMWKILGYIPINQ